jgi:FMN phosphatase YigB (HAD superfamily)
MKTAVLFDLGNVLVRLRFERGWARMRALAAGASPEEAARIAVREPGDGKPPRTTAPVPPPLALPETAARYLSARAEDYNRGLVPPPEFLAGLAAALGRPDLPFEACVDAWCDIFDPWPEMESLAEAALAAGHPVYLLSNTDPVHYEYLRRRTPVLDRFTGHHLSYEVHLAKPDPRYFETALARFGLSPEACAFVDDRGDNCAAALSVGIPSFVHRGDPEEVRRFLVGRGVMVRD